MSEQEPRPTPAPFEYGPFHARPNDEPAILSRVRKGIDQYGFAYATWAEMHDADPVVLSTFEQHYLGSYTGDQQLMDAVIERDLWHIDLLVLNGPDDQRYLFVGPDGPPDDE